MAFYKGGSGGGYKRKTRPGRSKGIATALLSSGAKVVVGTANEAKQMGEDAIWAAKNPLARIKGEGRARQQTMAVPMFGGGQFAKVWSSRLPGHEIRRAQAGDVYKTWDEMIQEVYPRQSRRNMRQYTFHDEPGIYTPSNDIIYNLIEKRRDAPLHVNDIRGSLNFSHVGPRINAHEIYIDPMYRKTKGMAAFQDFADILIAQKKPVDAMFANLKLEAIAKRKYPDLFTKKMSREEARRQVAWARSQNTGVDNSIERAFQRLRSVNTVPNRYNMMNEMVDANEAFVSRMSAAEFDEWLNAVQDRLRMIYGS